ncbi:hypothetical protein [Alginatibacterium sediminis]|uniref:hypothetical protein n=1 Tax=Alginatibacterium sediminis TaxID=2164068 RepID=UPI0013148D72|nr:hypothetical protein [Alginatibacterium sediminis]
MEAMGIIGFVFGLAGLSYALAAKRDIADLKQEFESLKLSLATEKPKNKLV